MPSLPNLLLIGAPTCGTTSLYRYLDQHPQIFMSHVKEPTLFLRLFARRGAACRIRAGLSNPVPREIRVRPQFTHEDSRIG